MVLEDEVTYYELISYLLFLRFVSLLGWEGYSLVLILSSFKSDFKAVEIQVHLHSFWLVENRMFEAQKKAN